jgi:uncharacterized protein YjbJ (UPF0337 family)
VLDSVKGKNMGKGTERVKGKVEEISGALKEDIGELIHSDSMQARGHAEKVEGQARQGAAKASERIKGRGEELVGKAKGAFGGLIGNEQLRVEGELDKLKGKGRRRTNR